MRQQDQVLKISEPQTLESFSKWKVSLQLSMCWKQGRSMMRITICDPKANFHCYTSLESQVEILNFGPRSAGCFNWTDAVFNWKATPSIGLRISEVYSVYYTVSFEEDLIHPIHLIHSVYLLESVFDEDPLNWMHRIRCTELDASKRKVSTMRRAFSTKCRSHLPSPAWSLFNEQC